MHSSHFPVTTRAAVCPSAALARPLPTDQTPPPTHPQSLTGRSCRISITQCGRQGVWLSSHPLRVHFSRYPMSHSLNILCLSSSRQTPGHQHCAALQQNTEHWVSTRQQQPIKIRAWNDPDLSIPILGSALEPDACSILAHSGNARFLPQFCLP